MQSKKKKPAKGWHGRNQIGALIASRRGALGLRQVDLANATGAHLSTIRSIETRGAGHVTPLVARILRLLEIDPAEALQAVETGVYRDTPSRDEFLEAIQAAKESKAAAAVERVARRYGLNAARLADHVRKQAGAGGAA